MARFTDANAIPRRVVTIWDIGLISFTNDALLHGVSSVLHRFPQFGPNSISTLDGTFS